MNYRAPLADLVFCLDMAGLEEIGGYPGCEEANAETVRAVLGECARFAQTVLAPLHRSGDLEPPRWHEGRVATSPGFQAAYRQFSLGGWQGLQHPVAYGGQGLPKLVSAAVAEIIHGAAMSFALCPMLTDGAIEALLIAGSDEQRAQFVPRLIDGSWTGTMNLTEPQAGSDLSLVRCKALPQGDGSFRLQGQKIYITYGEHDLAENIVHLVLARTPDAPDGVKGISLFLVPKCLPDGAGGAGRRNDVECASIEHKLGIRGSPTAVMVYGGGSAASEVGAGAVGYLVGAENRGLETMFIMMNAARFTVGVQGIGIAERALQQAVGYARERLQSRPVDGSSVDPVAIVRHPDVRRMLMTMRALVEGGRALAAVGAAAADASLHHPDGAERMRQRARYEFLVPVIKGFCTEMSLEVTSLGLQVHGGMGFIEETGAAQLVRDARILPIYEGTTAIQANDLVGRKTARDRGDLARAFAAEVAGTGMALEATGDGRAQAIAAGLKAARAAFLECVDFIAAHSPDEPNAVYAGSVPFLMLTGYLLTGWQLGRAALVALQPATRHGAAADAGFLEAKLATAHFHSDHLLSRTSALRTAVVQGSASVMALAEEAF